MKIQDAVALVTGANRGLGLAFTRALLAGGARGVHAAVRDPSASPDEVARKVHAAERDPSGSPAGVAREVHAAGRDLSASPDEVEQGLAAEPAIDAVRR